MGSKSPPRRIIRLRGHQLGYRDKTNSYDGWDLPQWDQYIRELAIFGTNAIELIPPRSDDRADSVHFPLPPLEMMEGMSRIADELRRWMSGSGTRPWMMIIPTRRMVEFALKEWEQVYRRLPRIDAILVPGGDPGNTRPKYLMPMLAKQTELLQRLPSAGADVDLGAGLQPGMDGRIPVYLEQ